MAQIKINMFGNSSVVDYSDNAFTINPVSNSVTVTSPNGGEVLSVGSTQIITWSWTGTFTYGAVEIWYSTDGGNIWTYINDYATNNGQHAWTVPNIPTTNALIKINEVYNTSVVDVSDAAFEIAAVVSNPVTVTAPNGGETITGGSTYNIAWSSDGSITWLDLYYSTNGGSTWNFIADHEANDGTFTWNVPNISTSTALIKITEFSNSSIYDESDAVFSITPVSNSVTVTSPNGGEVLSVGSTQIITWSWTGTFTYGAVEIWYSTDGGNLWTYINDYATNNGQYAWTVPNIPSTNALIKINEVFNTSVVDVSDSTFEIAAVVSNPVTVTAPNGGESLTGGSTYDITWSSDGSITWLDLYYSIDGGTNWLFIADHETNDGTFTWNVPNISTSTALIKITEFSNSSIYDESDAVFSISQVSNSVTVTSPNGGEVLTSGSTHIITWTWTGTFTYGAVEIWYSTDGGNIWTYINDYATNNGQHAWTVPNIPTTNALIKINEVYNSTVVDVSNSTFEIAAATNSITVLSPNGYESLSGGSTYDITWSSIGAINYVEIYYSIDAGTNWLLIDDYSPNDGIHSWNVANVNTANALIKIHEVFNSAIGDISNNVFTINYVPNSITVVAPNGGEVWSGGTTQNITWSTTGAIYYVEIWYSTDNGQVWSYIDDYSYNDGLYEWTVPGISTVSALIKINEVYNTSVVDVSDSTFEISSVVPNSITVITPNGGENITGGSSYNITWSSTGNFDYVEIWYSTDWGNTYSYIDDHAFNDGLFEWTVPNINTSSAIIKINQFGNTSLVQVISYVLPPVKTSPPFGVTTVTGFETT